MKQQSTFQMIKNILVTLAVINLILLFVFHYELPSFFQHKLDEHREANSSTESTIQVDSSLNIHFPEEDFIYDGSEDLDLTDGVTVTDDIGAVVKAELYASVSAGDNTDQKIVTYTANDSKGNSVTATRTLTLQNYDGPSITVGEDIPTITDTQLNDILTLFQDNKAIEALDGFDSDITSALTSSYTFTDETASEIEITFSVTNMFEESAEETILLPIKRTKPLIVLNQTSVTVSRSESFDPISYVASATNEEGKDLRDKIKLDGEIDLQTAGTYNLTYTLEDTDREQADPVTLEVTVE